MTDSLDDWDDELARTATNLRRLGPRGQGREVEWRLSVNGTLERLVEKLARHDNKLSSLRSEKLGRKETADVVATEIKYLVERVTTLQSMIWKLWAAVCSVGGGAIIYLLTHK